jgi:hypothetical protein
LEIYIKVFEPTGPVVGEGGFNPAAGDPAEFCGVVADAESRSLDVTIGTTGGSVE